MTEAKKPSPHGRTWPDLLSGYPVWIIALALLAFVALIIHATANNKNLGILGSFGDFDNQSTSTESSSSNSSIIPNDAVVAFTTECKAPWAPYKEAYARVIVGAIPNASDDNIVLGHPIKDKWKYYQGERHGEERVALQKTEMPRHNHIVRWGHDHHVSLNRNPDDLDSERNEYFLDWTKDGQNGGGNEDGLIATWKGGLEDLSTAKHQNMPPYIALHFCKKTAE
ncbi:MAG: hypothetical protein ABJN04_04400 [Hyphomicrobiales bacterium]